MKKLLLAAAITTVFISPAHAYDQTTIVLGLGANNWGKKNNQEELGGEVEVRFKKFDPASVWGADGVSPYLNVNAATDGSVFYGGGVLYDWEFAQDFHLVPQFGAGIYHRSNDGRSLGGAFNFRSSIEANYEFNQDMRVGVQLMHLSHTSLLYDDNPGTEHLLANFQYGL